MFASHFHVCRFPKHVIIPTLQMFSSGLTIKGISLARVLMVEVPLILPSPSFPFIFDSEPFPHVWINGIPQGVSF